MSLGEVIIANVIELLKEAQITSASPGWTNTVKDVRTTGLGSDFDYELELAIQEKISEYVATNPDLVGGSLDDKAKTKASKALSIEKTASNLARKTIGVAQNPATAFTAIIPLLPHAAFVALAISLAPIIFEILTKPGGPLDVRFKRVIDNEINGFLSRQTQKDTEFGFRQVIVQSKKGFTASNGANNYNTVRGIREGGIDKERLDRIGMVDHTKGLFT